MNYPNIPEEELKIRVGEDYFSDFDHATKIGKVDFCVLPKKDRNQTEGCIIANFSTLKNLQAPNFLDFRKEFQANLEKMFLVPAATFDNVNGSFPIDFFYLEHSEKRTLQTYLCDYL